jgi:hypothetical protein
MTLKTKLILGLGFLFLIIFTLAGFCSYYVGTLAQESDRVLKDNYYSLVYARNMLAGLDDTKTSLAATIFNTGRGGMSDYYARLFDSGRNVLETNLKAENKNITEIHEKEWVDRLNQDYDSYLKLCLQIKSGSSGSTVYFNELLPASERVKQSINAIYDINMQAVVRKNQAVRRDSSRFMNSMAIIGSVCLALAVFYFWYFPVYISTTLSYLADKMRNLLKSAGIAFDDTKTKDEAYAMLHAINLLENRLAEKREGKG